MNKRQQIQETADTDLYLLSFQLIETYDAKHKYVCFVNKDTQRELKS